METLVIFDYITYASQVMNKTRIFIAFSVILAVLVIFIAIGSKEDTPNDQVKVTLHNGKKVLIPFELLQGSEKQPIGTLYYLEGEGIIELTKNGWKNFKGETVLTKFEDDE